MANMFMRCSFVLSSGLLLLSALFLSLPRRQTTACVAFWTLWPELQEMSCFCILLGYKLKLQGIHKSPHPVVCGRKPMPKGKDMPQAQANLQDWTLSETLCLDGWVGAWESRPRKPAVEAHSALSPRVVSAIKAGSIG